MSSREELTPILINYTRHLLVIFTYWNESPFKRAVNKCCCHTNNRETTWMCTPHTWQAFKFKLGVRNCLYICIFAWRLQRICSLFASILREAHVNRESFHIFNSSVCDRCTICVSISCINARLTFAVFEIYSISSFPLAFKLFKKYSLIVSKMIWKKLRWVVKVWINVVRNW